jgi:hypothetical protein
MKYTRYNLKKKNKPGIKFIIAIFGTLSVCILLGIFMLKSFPSSSSSVNKNLPPVTDKKPVLYIAIQGGLYKMKENADETNKLLSDYGNPFIITEEDKSMRVFLGVYTEEEALKQMKLLTDKGVKNSKMTFQIVQSDLCDAEIIEILNANLKILSIASGKDVTSVKTDDFKKWCLALKEVDGKSKNINTLKELKDNASKLPEKLSKDMVSASYINIYNALRKFVVKTAPNK